MTDKCPDKDCLANVTRTVFFMKIFGITIIALIGILGSIITYSLGADERDKAKVQDIKTNQAVVMDNLNKAITRQDELQKNQQAIMINVQRIKDKIEHEAERSRKVDEVILEKLNNIQRTQ